MAAVNDTVDGFADDWTWYMILLVRDRMNYGDDSTFANESNYTTVASLS
jgi:hypothetical protein